MKTKELVICEGTWPVQKECKVCEHNKPHKHTDKCKCNIFKGRKALMDFGNDKIIRKCYPESEYLFQ